MDRLLMYAKFEFRCRNENKLAKIEHSVTTPEISALVPPSQCLVPLKTNFKNSSESRRTFFLIPLKSPKLYEIYIFAARSHFPKIGYQIFIHDLGFWQCCQMTGIFCQNTRKFSV